MNIKGWMREPFVQFIIAGAVIYGALTWSGDPVDPSSRVIEVGETQRAELSLQFERVWGRAPTDAEFDTMIERFIRDEVLYREAVRLGLDRGDAVVRQRMVSKMDMSASASAEAADPDEATLRGFFDENVARYAGEAAFSFDQLYFAEQTAAQAALSTARADAEASGEAISLPASLESTSLRDVQSRFGEVFAQGLGDLQPKDAWQGPVPSGFGWHIVRLRARSASDADFEALRGRVENDWRSAEIAARKERGFEVLRSAYRIEIGR